MRLLKLATKYWWVILLILFAMFAPATCNGVTYYTGIRGCGDPEKEVYTPGENKAFFNLITY
tara:strand:- start:339 stop:524 length:186 start_codon:yes stop_codon:yes gene_type:complete